MNNVALHFLFRMPFFYRGRLDWDSNSTSGRYVREMCKPIFVSEACTVQWLV